MLGSSRVGHEEISLDGASLTSGESRGRETGEEGEGRTSSSRVRLIVVSRVLRLCKEGRVGTVEYSLGTDLKVFSIKYSHLLCMPE